MSEIALWLLDKATTIALAALLAHGLTIRRDRAKRREDDTRKRSALVRRIRAELHLALMALVRARNGLDPGVQQSVRFGTELEAFRDALAPLIEVESELDVLESGDSLIGDLPDWLRRSRALIEEGLRAGLDDPRVFIGGVDAEGETTAWVEPDSPLRPEIRRRLIELESAGNRILHDVKNR